MSAPKPSKDTTPFFGMPQIARIKSAMRAQGLTPAALADKACVGRSFVYNMLSGRRCNPTLQTAYVLASVLRMPVGKFVLGLENVGVQTHMAEETEPLRQRTQPEEPCDAPLPYTSVVMVDHHSLHGEAPTQDATPIGHFSVAWIQSHLRTKPEDLRLYIVRDGTMSPTLALGDVVMLSVQDTDIALGGLFLLDDGKLRGIRRVEPIYGSRPFMVRVSADNALYGHYTCRLSVLNIVGKVVWYARRL
jgi:transcriptional regulator with XRE-family HTH domain